MTVLIAVLSVVGGGIAGSGLAFALSFRREQRRVRDAYRAPQRAAIAGIVAAINDLMLRVTEFNMFIEHSAKQSERMNQPRQGLPLEPTRTQYTDAEADLISGQTNRAVIGIDEAFTIGKLTIVDGLCYEAMVVAYKEFAKVQSAAVDLDTTPRTPDGLRSAIAPMVEYTLQLKRDSRHLIDVAQKQLAPPQSGSEERGVRAAKARLKNRYPEIRD